MSLRKIHKTLIILSALTLTGCVEPYDIKETNFEKVLVVSGGISNGDGPYFVRLSHTYPLDGDSSPSIENADVSVVDDSGNTFDFIASDSGVYVSPETLKGIVGRSYQLKFSIDGSDYESTMTTLRVSTPIDSVHSIYTNRLSDDEDEPVTGIQFFLDTHVTGEEPGFFRYEWSDAYLIQVPTPSGFTFDFEDSSFTRRDVNVGRCFSFSESNEFMIANTAESSQNRIANFPIHFIEESRQALRSRYSIAVKQYALDELTYNFYREVLKSNVGGGSLNAEQNGTVVGNIKSLSDPDELVLGYFEVAGVSELRTFFNASDFDDDFRTPNFLFDCFPPDIITTLPDSTAYYLNFFTTYRVVDFLPEGMVMLTDRSCSDCSWYADTTTEPDYWID